MSDPILRLPIESSFNPRGTDAATAALRQLQQLQQQATPKSGGDPYAATTAGAQKAVVANQNLATAQQRTATASNQAAMANQRLATEEQRTAVAAQNAAAAQSRAELAALRLAKAQDAAATSSQRGAGFAKQLGDAYTSSLMSIISPAAIATASIKAVGEAGELAKLGAQADAARGSFDNLAVSVHTTGSALLTGLRAAAAGTVSDANLISSANSGILLTGGKLATDLPRLLEIARASAQATGDDVGFVFDSLVKGIARGSPQIIDNAKITLDAEGAFRTYAASIGKTSDQLTRADQQQATLNAVLAAGTGIIEKTGGAAETTATDIARAGAAADNAKVAVGSLLATLLKYPAQITTEILISISGGINELAKSDEQLRSFAATAVETSHSFDDYGQKVDFINSQLAPLGASIGKLTESQYNYAKSLTESGKSAAAATDQAFQYSSIVQAADKATTDWGISSDNLRNQLVSLAQSGADNEAAVTNLVGALLNGNISAETFRSAIDQLSVAQTQAAVAADTHGGAIGAEIDMAIQAQAAMLAQSQATADAATQSLIDAQAKQEQAAQTAMMTAETQAAVDAFLALNPNLSASGAAAASGAAGFPPLIGRLIEATLRANEARNALALFNAMAGINAVRNAPIADRRDIQGIKHSGLVQQREEEGAAAVAAAEAERKYQQALSNFGPSIARANAELVQIGKDRGKNSAEYINQLTKIRQLEGQGASAAKRGGGGGGGGSGAVAAKAAQATGERIEDITRVSGSKLADIEAQAQQKIAQIDAKYAAQRLAAVRALNDQIDEQNASVKFDQMIDNFDAFQKDMTDAQRAAFAEREAAEARYNERIAAAQEEARQTAANGSADEASDVLKIREAQAKRQMEIEQRAAQANVDTNGKQAAAVAATAAQATKANEDEANTQIAIAKAKADEKTGAEQAEKDAVAASAKEQADKVIAAAEESSTKVRKASSDQRSAVIGNLQAQAQAVKDWADSIVSNSGRAQSAMGSVNGPSTSSGTGEAPASDTQAGGGGAFMTRGPTTLTVGDNPGGVELVHVVPLSGRGTTRVGAGMARMAGGGTLVAGGAGGGGTTLSGAISTLGDASAIINLLKPFVAANKGALKLLNEYKSIVTSAVGSLLAIQDLRERLVMPSPVLDPVVLKHLKDDAELVLNMMIAIDASAIKKIGVFGKYLTTEKEAIEILTQMQDLRDKLATPTPPISVSYIEALMRDSQAVLNILMGSFIPLKQRQVDDLKLYADAEGASVNILTGIADLRKRLSEDIGSPFNIALLRRFAERAADVTRMIQVELVPLSEEQVAGFKRFADATASSVQILTNVADLRKRLSEDTGSAFNMTLIRNLAIRAGQILQIVMAQLIPIAEDQSAAMQRYGDAEGNAVSILKNVADLRKTLSESTSGPFDMKIITKLASEARQILQIVTAVLVPTTEDQAKGLSDYANAVGSAVGIVRDVAGLRKDATELAGPIPVAVIMAMASEAKQIDQIVRAVLVPTSEEQAKGLSNYANAVSSSVGIISGVASLRKDTADLAGPIPEGAIIRLADDAKRITQIVLQRMVPTSQDQADAAKRFADTEGAAIQALKSVLDMPAKLFADYQSPSDAQIGMVVADANRIIRQVDVAARAYDTKGLDAAKAFSEAVGGTFTAFKEGLLFFEALNSGDFRLDPKNLAVFETSMSQTIAVAGRLGRQAVAIPPANVTALQNVTAALTASYESMIRLAAVPFGNTGSAAGALGGGGGGNTIITINNPPASMDVPGTIRQIKQGLGQSLGARR